MCWRPWHRCNGPNSARRDRIAPLQIDWCCADSFNVSWPQIKEDLGSLQRAEAWESNLGSLLGAQVSTSFLRLALFEAGLCANRSSTLYCMFLEV